MKKKNTKKNIPSNAGFGAVLEHIDSKLDLVVEGHKTLDRKIDKVDKKVDDLRDEMNYRFSVVFDELHLIRNDLKEKVSRDEFVLLEKRVSVLEKKR